MRPLLLLCALALLTPAASGSEILPSHCVEQQLGSGSAYACTPRVTDCPTLSVGDGGHVRVCLPGSAPTDADGDGYTTDDGDCDDADPSTHPGAPEQPDGADNDCDGLIDEGTGDFDGDGHALPMDCDDNDPSIHPGAPEMLGDGRDNDCDGVADDGTDTTDTDGDGVTIQAGDCDDTDPVTYPGAPEIHDRKDNDCNGLAEA